MGNAAGNAVGNVVGNAAGNAVGNLAGNGLGNDAVFSLNTWLNTIYCLQTINEPACVILTLFQYLLFSYKRLCTVHFGISGFSSAMHCIFLTETVLMNSFKDSNGNVTYVNRILT